MNCGSRTSAETGSYALDLMPYKYKRKITLCPLNEIVKMYVLMIVILSLY